jgi:hypothetical protein
MGIAYVAKAPVPVEVQLPEGWPENWDFPSTDSGPWAPSWPLEVEDGAYSMTVASPETIYVGESATVEATILDAYEDNTSDLDKHLVKVTATLTDDVLKIKKSAGDDYADVLYFQVENYAGEKYGISENVYFDLGVEDGMDTISVTCEVVSIDETVSASATSDVAQCVLVFTTEPSDVTRGIDFSLALRVENGNGIAMTDLDPETVLALSGADGADELSVVLVEPEDWTDGVWSDILQVTGGTGDVAAATITASATGYTGDSTELFEVRSPDLVFTTEPEAVTRGVEFTLAIEAQDGYGNVIVPDSVVMTLTLSGADESDVLNASSPSLSSGVWTSSAMQITGGDGTETGVTITAEAVGYASDTTEEFNIVLADTTYYISFEPQVFSEGNYAYINKSSSSEYSDGSRHENDEAGGGWLERTDDIAFKVWVDDEVYIEQAVAGDMDNLGYAFFGAAFRSNQGQTVSLPDDSNITDISISINSIVGGGPGIVNVFVRKASFTDLVLFQGSFTPSAGWNDIAVTVPE